MDIYPGYLMPSVKRRVHLLGSLIRAGLTEQLHPFDRTVFGCLKATKKSLQIKFVHSEPGAQMTKRRAAQIPQ
jgi:hypothetical protein